MTKTEISFCQTSMAEYITDAGSADFVQDLASRLKSAASMMETAIQECVTIFDDMEQISNERALSMEKSSISVQFSPKVEEGSQFAAFMAELLSEALMQGSEYLHQKGIAWYAEEEPVNAVIDGQDVKCWHMSNDGETAVVCTEYLGGPRTEVPLSALSPAAE